MIKKTLRTQTNNVPIFIGDKIISITLLKSLIKSKDVVVITNVIVAKYHLKNLKNKRVLVSRELDRQFEAEIIRFSNQYKNVTPIIVLRRHEEYFASQYKRRKPS